MADTSKTKIFISYRREDSAYASGSIYGHLVARFGRERVFKDVDAIPPGVDFRQHIRGTLAESAVALVVIGRRWLEIALPDGRRRLDDPNDPVRMEIEATLERGIPIIPLLVDGAGMPHQSQLPESMRAVADYSGLFVRPDPDFEGDVRRVIAAIERWMGGAMPPSPSPSPSAAQAHQLAEEAHIALGAGRYSDALARADLAHSLAPDAVTVTLHADRALALAGLGRWNEALTAANAALELDLSRVDLLRIVARAEQRQGNTNRAVAALDRARALIPLDDHVGLLDLLGERYLLLTEQQKWDAMLVTTDDALRLSPDDPIWLDRKLRTLTELGRQDDALMLTRQLTARPDATATQWLSRAYLARAVANDDDEVTAALDAAARLSGPNDPAIAETRKTLLTLPIPPERLPAPLDSLGFIPRKVSGTDVIVPPVVPVPAGEFLMGSDRKDDAQAFEDELPQHTISLQAYRIGKFPVTVAEYAGFVRAGQAQPENWRSQLGHLDHPIACVTWHDATAYAAWLAQLTGQPWRLPSEAEWEKAARWDAVSWSARIYPWGDHWDKTRCNSTESGIDTLTPVDVYPTGASPCGALDMAGNIWEWTSTLFKPYPYSQSDGREDANSPGSRVLRGGSWTHPPRSCRAAYRYNGGPGFFHDYWGFRLVLAAPGS